MSDNNNGLTRRDFLAGVSATAAAFGMPGMVPAFASAKPLRICAAEKGILFGSAIRAAALKDVSYADVFARQCSITVPEGSLKWDSLRPTSDRYDFSGGDWFYEFAKTHEMIMRGHALVWEQALPSWFESTVNAGNAQKMMTSHISTVMRHYAGKVPSWDVVNEAVQMEDGREDGLKVTPWLRFMGPEYIEIAFRAAHDADPNATLVYNDNWIEPDDSGSEKRRRAVLVLLTNLKKRNVPVHGLGIQSHVFAEANVTGANFRRFLQEVESLGLSILITEMDVRDQNLPADIQTRDRLVAEQYEKYLSFLLQFKSVKTILTWGLSSRYTWISSHNKRADGLPTRPLLYDADLRPTATWDAIQRVFEHASRR